MEIKMPKFSERIKELRIEKGLTQAEIPTLTLAFLADYFEVSTDYLLGRSDDRRIL